jgi:hypothetical protein
VGVTACGGDDDDDPTATVTAGSTPRITQTASGELDTRIRTLDLEGQAAVQELIAGTAGEVIEGTILYGDLTDDNVAEAVVPISSGGTLGDVAYVVLTPQGEGAEAILTRDDAAPGFRIDIENGKLVETEPVRGPDDPECCPSMARRTVYAWNGAALAIESSDTVAAADGGIKGTPVATP